MTVGIKSGDQGATIAGAPPIDQPDRYPYQPALDGVRALAVTAVVLFHFGVAAVGGGFLGVDVFLALSGFLITTLILREFASTGQISIGAFYGRRARRLLPGLLVVLAAVALYAQFVAGQLELLKLRGDALASLLYVANWRFIFEGTGYFQQFAMPSPVDHLWSLAIEEQWYLVWPLLMVGLLSVLGPPLGRQRRVWVGCTVGLAAISALVMAVLVDDANVNRVYYGTDTRAQTLLVGAALALLFHGRSLSPGAQRRLDDLGLLGLLGCVAMFVLVDDMDLWMYRGGFALVALCSALLIAGAAGSENGWTSKLLSLPPLPELGRISYGVYLWHWPVFVLLDEDRTALTGGSLFMVRVAVTLLISIASFELVERPVRQRAWPTRQGAIAAIAGIATATALVLAVIPVQPSPDEILAARSGGPVPPVGSEERILVAGDSVGLSLALGNWAAAIDHPAVLRGATALGCVIPIDATPCRGGFEKWRKAIQFLDPDVTVLVLGRWELYDRAIDGKQLRFGSTAFESWLLGKLERGIAILTSHGGRVLLFTVPCFNAERLNAGGFETKVYGQPHNTPADIGWLNGVFRKAALKAGPAVGIVDYGSYLCPNGNERSEIDGVEMRADGVHLTTAGASLVWRWLAPQLPAARATTPE